MSHYSGSIPDPKRKTDWRDTAACAPAAIDAEMFFAGEREPGLVEEARQVCRSCPVRTQCVTAAYQDDDTWSIRGGLTNRQRLYYLRKNDGSVPRAIAEATGDTTFLLRHIYQQHAQPSDDGHILWTDTRHFINVQSKPYTVHQLAFRVCHGRVPVGQVKRVCDREGCVAAKCLADRVMRDRKKAAA